jgi:hypothetical protein
MLRASHPSTFKKIFVTPSVTKASKKKRPSSSTSSIVLAKQERSNSCSTRGNISVVYVCAKKKKTRTNKKYKNKKSELLNLVSSTNLSSGDNDKNTLVGKPAAAATLEVKKEVETQLLPQTDDFGQSKVAQEDDENIRDEDENISHLSQNLLEDDDDE